MANDIRSLRPIDALRLVNSTRIGPVLDSSGMRRLMDAGGLLVGDGKRLDLLKLAAWLRNRRAEQTNPDAKGRKERDYEAHRAAMAARSRAKALAGREVGPLPSVADPERRERCRTSFRLFCETYFAETFNLGWSDDHLKAIARIEDACIRGGLFAFAMPRGSGKTSLVEAACLWAILFGYRRFVALIGPTEDHAERLLESIKLAVETEDLLLDDFPEASYLIRKLEGIVSRANGQLLGGERTHIEWGAKSVVFPTVPGSSCSGAIIRVAGLTGQIRGMVHRTTKGQKLRPDLVVLDDPQTDESARSPSQCSERVSVLSGAILGLAGPGKKISGFMPCTVIKPGDMADQILDREKHPAWQGERWKLVVRWPDREDLWLRYAELRKASQRNGGRGETATAFYGENREAMDAGGEVAWEHRRNEDQLSALQHAWDLRIDHGDRAFFSEFQNDPLPDIEANADDLDPDDIERKVNGLSRAELPVDASAVTMFVDVQQAALYWLIAAWAPDFTGAIIDYGTWPDQKSDYFTLAEVRRTIARAAPGASFEGMIYKALSECCGEQLRREFKAANGATLRVSKCLIDANWGRSTEIVYQYARQGDFAGIVSPSHGRYYGASSLPFSDHRPVPGERMGHRWRIPPPSGRRAVRYVLFDTNWWKSSVADRLRLPIGDRGALSLWGGPRTSHRMLAEHLTAERRIPTEARGRKVDEWKLKRPGLDNHLLDCIVGASVAASIVGVAVAGPSNAVPAAKRKVRLSELQAKKRGAA